MFPKIAILTLNPGIDRIVYLDAPLSVGGHNRSSRAVVCQGSKGANQAIMLKNLGIDADYFSFTGGVYGGLAEKFLSERGIRQNLVETACGVRLNIKVIDGSGIGTELNESGGPVSDLELDELLSRLYAGNYDVVSLCGSFPQGVENSVYNRIITRVRATGAKVVLDAAGEALRLGVKASPYLIKPNRFELSALKSELGLPAETAETPETAISTCGKVFREYGTRIICTLDADGSVYAGPEGCYRITVAPQELHGFSGAGDSHLAAFIAAESVFGMNIADSLKFASAASCAKIRLDGTIIPTRAQLDAALDAVTVEKVG